jgi:type I restriction enzyme M protein
MSYDEFKRRIDTARNILVGAVPSPAGQIDQITYALIYKFMNDIDDKAASLPGGKRKYFVGDYEKYNWHALMAPSLGAQERLELYRQAIETMSKNDHLPELFRTLYQNAFLPYNSAPVLTMLLKEIEKFTHTDGDDIGDVYEYLLSITGAQGDVGQFRTPRHIIKFIVEAVNPTKDDTVLDPACGTAGFLIAAYLHVKHQHDGKDNEGQSNNETRLSADELDKLHHHYRGFDIDPTMVRTAKVNMYLHDFRTPEIINHDSLSSDDYWNDKYDVILANPPFMTPKGGIQPHKKFSISANRAEVLFVDYIASHLKPTGRAGIIVPEGIIFQSGNAYKQLRKNLVENYLYAVVSLPSGVFNPYAGVKTSILLLDKELAKKRKEILFVKIENDGYSLGAQRRIVPGNQLPYAEQIIDKFKSELINIDDLQQFATDIISHKHPIKDDLRYCEPIQINLVPTDEVTESGDYNLSGDRYLVNLTRSTHDWPIVSLGDELLFKIESGGTPDSKEPSYWDGGIPWATLVDLPSENHFTEIKTTVRTISSAGLANSSAKLLPVGTILLSSRATIGRVAIARTELATNQGFKNIIAISDTVLPEFIAHLLTSMTDKLKSLSTGGTFAEFSKSSLAKVQIPLHRLRYSVK